MKPSHTNKLNDGQNVYGDADNDYQLRNTEEKSSVSSDEHENDKVGVANHKELVTRYQKKDAGLNNDGGNLHEEHSKHLELETSLQSHHTDGSDESDVVEHDVKVCDTCGDAGREDLLATCFRCIDGAEHTYCMRVMVDQVPKSDWLCEECKLEVTNTNRQINSTDNLARKEQFSEGKVSGKRRAEELVSSSSFKKQALEAVIGPTKDLDRGKVKTIHQFSSDPHFGNESTAGSRSLATGPQLQSLQGAFSKSSSFSFPNARSKTKLVDEIVLQRQKSTNESSHYTIAAKEMSKSVSFRSTNLGSSGPNGSKVKMLSPKLAHVQDLKSLQNKKERNFEKSNSVKLISSNSAALTPKIDRLLSSRGESNSVYTGSNAEVKQLKGDSKIVPGLKSTNRLAIVSAEEAPMSLGQFNEQLPSSPTKVGTTSCSGVVNSIEYKSMDNSSKVAISKESTNIADGIKENTTYLNLGSSRVSCQNNQQTGHSAQGLLGNNVSAMKTSKDVKTFKDVKNRDNKLKDAIEAALLKKPGIYRKNKVSDQPDESSVLTMNYEAGVVDRVPHSRNAGSFSFNVDHSKHSNGNSYKHSMLLPAQGKQLTGGLSSHDDVALSSLSNKPIPDRECIWRGSFEISRSGKTAEFWDGLQAHLSTCASPRVYEAVNKFPHKILLNGVSRASTWPTQFESNGLKEDSIGIYFFAKDVESYEKSYQVLLDDMIRGDLALIGSIDGVELLIFPSNRLPEKSNRWNMFFFLWGVFRGKKKNSLHQVHNPEKSCDPRFVSSASTGKTSLAENAGSFGSVEEDKHADTESKVNSNLQNSSNEKARDSISRPVESVKHVDLEPKIDSNMRNSSPEKAIDSNTSSPVDRVDTVPVSSNVITSETHMQNEPIKRSFIDLSDDVNSMSETHTWRGQESKKQKGDLHGERYFFPVNKGKTQQTPVFALDLNEDISCLVGETDNIIMKKKDVAALPLAFSPPPDKEDDYEDKGKWQSGFRDMGL